MKTAPQLVEKYNKLFAGNDKFEMIHVSMDEDTATAEKWAVQENFPWPTILPENAGEEGIMSLYPEEGVPEYMIFDASGKEVLIGPSKAIFEKLAELAK